RHPPCTLSRLTSQPEGVFLQRVTAHHDFFVGQCAQCSRTLSTLRLLCAGRLELMSFVDSMLQRSTFKLRFLRDSHIV
ncbi:hypothetical protein, partial [Providencia rettgeri]|uniref:hypothetical protein n=1 Tax=Providencia rettgeri TaxID=587 RepID=UPI002360311E